jgi:hypothetical protein
MGDTTTPGAGIIDRVTGATDEIWAGIEHADGMPHGRARISALEALLTRLGPGREVADESGELRAVVQGSLMPACLYGGEHQRVPELLGRLLTVLDEAPSWLGEWERRGILFGFGWATTGLLQHPDVSLDLIRRGLTEMETRYAAAGEPPGPLLRARYHLARHVRGAEAAQPEFEAWRAAAAGEPRGEASGCAFCERAEQVRQLADAGQHEAAVTLALDDRPPAGDCPVHPVATLSAVLASLLVTGRSDQAVREHVRAVRLIRAHPDDRLDADLHSDPGRADQLLACARSGQLQRGLDLIEEWLPWYSTAAPPTLRLRSATAFARTLRGLAEAGHGGLRLAAPGGESTTVDELGARLTREARELGARFDSRNETSTVGDEVERVIAAEPLPALPITPLMRNCRTARAGSVSAPSGQTRRGRRGRRAVVPPVAAAVGADDPVALAKTFDEALAADSRAGRTAVLDAWRVVRTGAGPGDPDGWPADEEERAAARLDGWLAIEDADAAASAAAAERLRSAGLATEALLHEQAFLLAAAEHGRAEHGRALERIERLAIEVAEAAAHANRPGDAGLALSRLVLMREVARAGADPDLADPAGDPLEAALAALDSVPRTDLDHQQLRARARLLRLRAVDEPPEAAVETLREAVGTLPDGVRPLERALAGADLAQALHESNPPAALAAWDRAIADAAGAGADELLGGLLAAGAALHHALGDPARAAADLLRAVPLLDANATPELAAQGRLDLSRALLGIGRAYEAAEVAEAALADLTELLRHPVQREDLGPERHLAGCAAFAAAEALAAGDEPEAARELARTSASWHRENGNLIAEAEAWQLAAGLDTDPAGIADDLARAARLAEQGGDWARAATCLRERANALNDADGPAAAIAALGDVDRVLAAAAEAPAGRHASPEAQAVAERQLRWHRLAVADQRARMLAVSGRFADAMAQVDGAEAAFRELGDTWSARDLLGLQGQLKAELGDLEGALGDLRRGAEEAEEVGDRSQQHGLGERLCAVLALAGREPEAEAAYDRFCA